MKSRVNISVDTFILEEAKKKNINISETCERAIVNKIDPANIPAQEPKESDYPFEVCSKDLPETFKTRLFGMCGIKAKRCHQCDEIYFINDLAGEFTLCKNCFRNKPREKLNEI